MERRQNIPCVSAYICVHLRLKILCVFPLNRADGCAYYPCLRSRPCTVGCEVNRSCKGVCRGKSPAAGSRGQILRLASRSFRRESQRPCRPTVILERTCDGLARNTGATAGDDRHESCSPEMEVIRDQL